MNKMDWRYETVALDKLTLSGDRAAGGMGDIDVLAEDMRENGLINPILVREDGGGYFVIAGNRRVAAAQMLGWEEINATIIDGGDEESYTALATSENVNRADMHPLDEGALYVRLVKAGKHDVNSLCRYYGRGKKGIYQRMKLTQLTDDLKEFYRAGKLSLNGAAMVASLPKNQQEAFFKKYKKNDYPVSDNSVAGFAGKAGNLALDVLECADCEACSMRTNFYDNSLFDANSIDDFCFDPECYKKKFSALLASLIEKQGGAERAEKRVFAESTFSWFWAERGAESAGGLHTADIGGTEYVIIPYDHYQTMYKFKATNKKAVKGTAWRLYKHYQDIGGGKFGDKLFIERVDYAVDTKKNTSSDNGDDAALLAEKISDYSLNPLADKLETDEEKAALVERVEKKFGINEFNTGWKLRNSISEFLREKFIVMLAAEANSPALAINVLDKIFLGKNRDAFNRVFGDIRDIKVNSDINKYAAYNFIVNAHFLGADDDELATAASFFGMDAVELWAEAARGVLYADGDGDAEADGGEMSDDDFDDDDFDEAGEE